MLPAESNVTPGISLLLRLRGPIPERNNRSPTRFACGNAPTGSGARELSKDLLIFFSLRLLFSSSPTSHFGEHGTWAAKTCQPHPDYLKMKWATLFSKSQ